MTHPDFRALCAELVARLDYRIDGLLYTDSDYDLIDRARAALPAPQQGAPSDDDCDLLVIAIQALAPHQPDATTHDLQAVDRGRKILRQWLIRYGGQLITQRQPTTKELFDLSSVCNSPSVFARAVLARYGWPGYHTHFTRIVCPALPLPEVEA